MHKRILLGVDAPVSPATQNALRTVCEFVEEATSETCLILLHVIPVPNISSPTLGMYTGQMQTADHTSEQRALGELALRRARTDLENRGLRPEQIETLLRQGTPAEETVKVAKEMQVDLIVIGCRGNSVRQQARRFFAGSTSRRILNIASCPVMIVVPPAPLRIKQPHDLVKWYEEAITRYLQEHSGDLTVFTPQQVALAFAPSDRKEPGRKEQAAAILALEKLTRSGLLCRRDVKGEMRYVND
ncbi:MAG TPA: universal stress protein [Ktedonobacteraceae bacterium]|nr:universal stress protein [Ktedonobacteraceae bacterium]